MPNGSIWPAEKAHGRIVPLIEAVQEDADKGFLTAVLALVADLIRHWEDPWALRRNIVLFVDCEAACKQSFACCKGNSSRYGDLEDVIFKTRETESASFPPRNS